MGLKFLFCCDDCKTEEIREGVYYSACDYWDFVVIESAESLPSGWKYDNRFLCKKCSKAVNLKKAAVSEQTVEHWGP